MLDVSVGNDARHYDGGDRLQPGYNVARFFAAGHLRVAGCESAIWRQKPWIFLDREEQRRHRAINTSANEVRGTDCRKRRTAAGAGAETQRGINMLDRDRVGPRTV